MISATDLPVGGLPSMGSNMLSNCCISLWFYTRFKWDVICAMPLCRSRSVPIVSWCNHRIVRVLWIWIALPSRLHHQDFNTLRIRAVLNLLLLFTLCTLTRVAHEFSHNSGSKRFSPWENKPWSNNQDNLSSEAENGDYWSNNHNEVCSEMGGSCWPPVTFLLTWRQPENCTNLGTLVSVGTCMLPQWHLQQQHSTL